MNKPDYLLRYVSLLAAMLVAVSLWSQSMTKIRGRVTDAQTSEALPFVNVVFKGKSIGTVTDYNGYYQLESQWGSDSIQVSFLGYNTASRKVVAGRSQVLDIALQPDNIELGEVKVATKKKRYRNKDNPAVDLIRKVIEYKNNNRKEGLDYYTYDKYEKVEFDLNNISEDFRQKKIFKKFQFIFDYVDTSEINGKPYLPMFFKERFSEVYYRKEPKAYKEYVKAENMVGFDDYVDDDGISYFIDNMYQDIDIYDNTIMLLTNPFVSPVSDIAPVVYKYLLMDTLDVQGHECIQLAFQPRNKADFAFVGNMYITNDGGYAVKRIEMEVPDEINLNFVNDILIVQEFNDINDSCWLPVKDEITIDFNLTKKSVGMFGSRKVYLDNFNADSVFDDAVFSGIEKVNKEDDAESKDEQYWDSVRGVELSENEKGVFKMIDSLHQVPAFKTAMDVMVLLLAGYWDFGPIDVGPVNTFYSFNDVEGFRLRLGGRTNQKFSKRFRIEAYGLYGFKDERFKYSLSTTWSLNEHSVHDKPDHTLRLMHQIETNFPGMQMQFVNEDNFLLSIKRGVSDKILYYQLNEVEHCKDWGNGISTSVSLKHLIQEPGGTLKFNYADRQVETITTSEVIAKVRFAPNEMFYSGMNYNTPIINKYPILNLTYTQGFSGVLDGEYTYSKLNFNLFKRFYLPLIGYTDTEFEAGKVFGTLPFPLLSIHRANQTYSYQMHSYNLMNFLEFVSDEYVSFHADHHFNGFLFNKVALLKRLKLREVVSFKAVYGGVTAKNNPFQTEGLMAFPVDENGNPTSFTLRDKPYVEVSAGIENIIKLFRIDLVRRLTYLNNPNVSKLGIRVRFKFDF